MDASQEDQLRQACYDIANSTQWEPNDPQSTSLDNVTPAAKRYFEIARQHAAHTDPNVVVHAVRFLSHAFAIPPLKEHDAWLDEGLTVLLYLLSPDVTEGATREFLVVLRDALEQALNDEGEDDDDNDEERMSDNS